MSECSEDYWIEMGRRAVACEGWRWMPGMLDMDGDRIVSLAYDEVFVGWGFGDACDIPADTLEASDLRDAATVGCLLALVREAWHTPTSGAPQPAGAWVCVARVGEQFEVRVGSLLIASGHTEAEALVLALENAPPRKG